MKQLTGAELIAQERKRQIEVEGFTPDQDAVKYRTGDGLAYAAAAYALPDELQTEWQKQNLFHRSNLFPWGKEWWKPSPKDRIRELTKAGALIAAEIDRLLNQNTQQ